MTREHGHAGSKEVADREPRVAVDKLDCKNKKQYGEETDENPSNPSEKSSFKTSFHNCNLSLIDLR